MIIPAQMKSSEVKPDYNFVYIWLISIVAALGGLLFGYDWVVIGGAKPFFEKYFHLTTSAQSGWVNSCALIGCLVGSLVAGALSDKYGRKRLLIMAALLFAVTSLGNALASQFLRFRYRMADAGGVGIRIGVESFCRCILPKLRRPGCAENWWATNQPVAPSSLVFLTLS